MIESYVYIRMCMLVCINDLPSFTLVFINYSLINSLFQSSPSFVLSSTSFLSTYVHIRIYIRTYAHTCVHTHTYTTSPVVSHSSVPRSLPQSRETPFSSHPLYSEVSQTASSIFCKDTSLALTDSIKGVHCRLVYSGGV